MVRRSGIICNHFQGLTNLYLRLFSQEESLFTLTLAVKTSQNISDNCNNIIALATLWLACEGKEYRLQKREKIFLQFSGFTEGFSCCRVSQQSQLLRKIRILAKNCSWPPKQLRSTNTVYSTRSFGTFWSIIEQ